MTGATTLRLGTRGSRLALAQARHVAARLEAAHPGLSVPLVLIQTTGDRILDSSLARIGGKGVFTKEIEEALLDGRIDLAVHSLKDVPTAQPAGLALGAITARESPWDVLLARAPIDWRATPGLRVGTSSLRRRAQLLRVNPRLEIAELRGNVPTRLRRVLDGEYDAIVLAAAGLDRLGEAAPWHEVLAPADSLPAPGQGALAIQIRQGDTATAALVSVLHDIASAACCTAERALLHHLGGGCQAPLGAHAQIQPDGRLRLTGRVLTLDGARVAEATLDGSAAEPDLLGAALASRLSAGGAGDILATIAGHGTGGFEQAVARAGALDRLPLGGRLVIVTRDEDADGPLSTALRAHGALPQPISLLAHEPVPGALDEALAGAPYDWLLVTSARGVAPLAALGACPAARLAAVGPGTAAALARLGWGTPITPPAGEEHAEGIVARLAAEGLAGRRILHPCADRSDGRLAAALRAHGAHVVDPVVYRTVDRTDNAALLRAVLPRAAAVTFASASAAGAFARLIGGMALPHSLIIASIGPMTTRELQAHGLRVDVEASEHTFTGLAEALVTRAASSPAPPSAEC